MKLVNQNDVHDVKLSIYIEKIALNPLRPEAHICVPFSISVLNTVEASAASDSDNLVSTYNIDQNNVFRRWRKVNKSFL